MSDGWIQIQVLDWILRSANNRRLWLVGESEFFPRQEWDIMHRSKVKVIYSISNHSSIVSIVIICLNLVYICAMMY